MRKYPWPKRCSKSTLQAEGGPKEDTQCSRGKLLGGGGTHL